MGRRLKGAHIESLLADGSDEAQVGGFFKRASFDLFIDAKTFGVDS